RRLLPSRRMRSLSWMLIALAMPGCRRAQPHTAPTGPAVVECPARGCAGDAGPAKGGRELGVHVDAEPAILGDLVGDDAWSRWILENNVVETLLRQDPATGAVGPHLAERFESDARSLTLHLRAGVTWHDGQPFTAADVAFTLGRARDPAVGADQRADL